MQTIASTNLTLMNLMSYAVELANRHNLKMSYDYHFSYCCLHVLFLIFLPFSMNKFGAVCCCQGPSFRVGRGSEGGAGWFYSISWAHFIDIISIFAQWITWEKSRSWWCSSSFFHAGRKVGNLVLCIWVWLVLKL